MVQNDVEVAALCVYRLAVCVDCVEADVGVAVRHNAVGVAAVVVHTMPEAPILMRQS